MWLITLGIALSVVGLEGLAHLIVSVSGRLIVGHSRAQVAGSRMSRAGADALLGVSATAVAVLFIMFMTHSNFNSSPPDIGDFDVAVDLPNLSTPERIAEEVAAIQGVARVVTIGRTPVDIDWRETSLYTMTCDDAPDSVELDAPCVAGSIYIQDDTEAAFVEVSGDSNIDIDESIPGVYPVGGRIAASWMQGSGRPVLMVERQPTPNSAVLPITTDGASQSLRNVLEALRARPEELYANTRAALTANITPDTLIFNPYMLVMATVASAMAAVALLYGVLLLLSQRQAEFRTLRSLGATRALLSSDLGLLLAAPLMIAFRLAVSSGLLLAVSYNIAFGRSVVRGETQSLPVLATILAIGIIVTIFVTARAYRIPTLVADPDAVAR